MGTDGKNGKRIGDQKIKKSDMKNLFLTILILSVSFPLAADERSGEIIGQLGRKFNGYGSYKANFTVNASDDGTSSGEITVSGRRFAMNAHGIEVFYDGATLWTYSKEDKEVNIETLDPDDRNVMTNPSKLMAINAADFTHRMLPDARVGNVMCNVVELVPVEKTTAYSHIEVYFDPSQGIPRKMVIKSNDSADRIELTISKITPDVAVTTDTFRFDARKHPGVDVIDFR